MVNVAKYDRESVIRQAMLLFWEKGFYATSTRDLQQAVNLRPGSFYAAFGSKESLFREALRCYAGESQHFLAQKIAEHDSVTEGLRAFIRGIVLERRKQAPSDLCMLVKTVAELNNEQQELLEEGRRLLARTEKEIAGLLRQAQEKAEVRTDLDPEVLASEVMVQMMGLRSYLRSSQNEATVSRLIDQLFVEWRTGS